MTIQSREDVDLEALLARESDISRAWRVASAEQPSAAMDDALHAAARRAVNAGPRAGRASFAVRWRVPLSIAALLVVSASLTLLVAERKEHLPGATLEQAPGPAVHARPELAIRPEMPKADGLSRQPDYPSEGRAPEQQRSSKSGEPTEIASDRTAAPRPDKRQSDEGARRRNVAPEAVSDESIPPASSFGAAGTLAPAVKMPGPAGNVPAPAGDVSAPAGNVPAPAGNVPAPAANQTTSGPPSAAAASRITGPAHGELQPDGGNSQTETEFKRDSPSTRDLSARPSVQGAPADATDKRKAEQDSAAPQPQKAGNPATTTRPVDAGPALMEPRSQGGPVSSRAEENLEPAAWIKRILDLRHQGKLKEAAESLDAFRRRYPDYRLPPELDVPQ